MSTEHSITSFETGSRRWPLPYELFLNIIDMLILDAEDSAIPIAMEFSIAGEDGRVRIEHDLWDHHRGGRGFQQRRRFQQLRLALQTNRRTRRAAEKTFRPVEIWMPESARTAAAWVLPELDSFRPYHFGSRGWEPIRLVAGLGGDFTRCLGILNCLEFDLFKEDAAEKFETIMSLPSLRLVGLIIYIRWLDSEMPYRHPVERSVFLSPDHWNLFNSCAFKSFLDQAEAREIVVLASKSPNFGGTTVVELARDPDADGVCMDLY